MDRRRSSRARRRVRAGAPASLARRSDPAAPQRAEFQPVRAGPLLRAPTAAACRCHGAPAPPARARRATGAPAALSAQPAGGASAPAAGSCQGAGAIQQSIARIQEACQAPTLAPQEYRPLFEVMAQEITDNDLIGAQTLANIAQRAHERGLEVRRDDVRFMLEVVSESDPWFEQGASAESVCGPLPQFRGGALPRPGPQPVGRRARPDRRLVRRRDMPQPQAQTSQAARAAPSRPAAASAPPPAAQPGRTSTPPVSLPTPAPAAAAAGGRWWANEPGAGEANKEAAAPAQSGGGNELAPADEFPALYAQPPARLAQLSH